MAVTKLAIMVTVKDCERLSWTFSGKAIRSKMPFYLESNTINCIFSKQKSGGIHPSVAFKTYRSRMKNFLKIEIMSDKKEYFKILLSFLDIIT